jgi:hypothetical protein
MNAIPHLLAERYKTMRNELNDQINYSTDGRKIYAECYKDITQSWLAVLKERLAHLNTILYGAGPTSEHPA